VLLIYLPMDVYILAVSRKQRNTATTLAHAQKIDLLGCEEVSHGAVLSRAVGHTYMYVYLSILLSIYLSMHSYILAVSRTLMRRTVAWCRAVASGRQARGQAQDGGCDACPAWTIIPPEKGKKTEHTVYNTKRTRAHPHRELIREWLCEPTGSSLEYRKRRLNREDEGYDACPAYTRAPPEKGKKQG